MNIQRFLLGMLTIRTDARSDASSPDGDADGSAQSSMKRHRRTGSRLIPARRVQVNPSQARSDKPDHTA